MLDDWEMQFQLDPFNPADAWIDLDGDGVTNIFEFENNTSPIVPDLPGYEAGIEVLYAQSTTPNNRWGTDECWSSANPGWDGNEPDTPEEVALFTGTPTRTAAVLSGGHFTIGQIRVTALTIGNMEIREASGGGGSLTLDPSAWLGGVGIDMSVAARQLIVTDTGDWTLKLGSSQEWRVTSASPGADLLFTDKSSPAVLTVDLQGHALTANVGVDRSIVFDQPVVDSMGTASLIKAGEGALIFNVTNSYTGLTTVAAGTLGGTGVLAGPVEVQAQACLAPGMDSIGALEIQGSLLLHSNSVTVMEVNRTGLPSADKLVCSGGTLTFSGSLVITNVGAALEAGDTFDLFDAPAFGGTFTIDSRTPNQIVTWDADNLSMNGTIRVASVMAPEPPALDWSLSAGSLEFSWPAAYANWIVQSNAVGLHSPESWFDVPGSQSGTHLSIPIVLTTPAVYYRLRQP